MHGIDILDDKKMLDGMEIEHGMEMWDGMEICNLFDKNTMSIPTNCWQQSQRIVLNWQSL